MIFFYIHKHAKLEKMYMKKNTIVYFFRFVIIRNAEAGDYDALNFHLSLNFIKK